MVHNFMMPPKVINNAAEGRGRGRKSMGLGEGTLILSDIRRLGPFLGVQIVNFWGEGGSERVISKFKFRYRIGIFSGGCKLSIILGYV